MQNPYKMAKNKLDNARSNMQNVMQAQAISKLKDVLATKEIMLTRGYVEVIFIGNGQFKHIRIIEKAFQISSIELGSIITEAIIECQKNVDVQAQLELEKILKDI